MVRMQKRRPECSADCSGIDQRVRVPLSKGKTMGVVSSIDYESFPEQSTWTPPGTKVRVCFKYDTTHTIDGEIVRADVEDPGVGIIRLADGRHVLFSECQYSIVK